MSYVTFVSEGLLYEKIEVLGSREQIITLWLEGRNSMKKRLMTVAAAVCGAVMMAMPVLAANAGWQRDNRGWWYRYADGGYAKSAWVSDNGNWYRMDENGYMQTGWVNLNGDWYYLDASGSMQTGAIVDNGYHYLLSTQHDGRYGHMVRNGESFEGRIIKAWTAGSGHPEGALQEDNTIGIGESYSGTGNTGAAQSGKRGEDIPPANVDTAQDGAITNQRDYIAEIADYLNDPNREIWSEEIHGSLH